MASRRRGGSIDEEREQENIGNANEGCKLASLKVGDGCINERGSIAETHSGYEFDELIGLLLVSCLLFMERKYKRQISK